MATIASVVLCRPEKALGAVQQVGRRLLIIGHAHRHAGGHGRGAVAGAHGFDDLLSHAAGTGGWGAGQRGEELIGLAAEDNVAVASAMNVKRAFQGVQRFGSHSAVSAVERDEEQGQWTAFHRALIPCGLQGPLRHRAGFER